MRAHIIREILFENEILIDMTRKRPKVVKKQSKVKFSVQGLGGLFGHKKVFTSVVDHVFLGGSPVSMPASPALAPRTLRRPAQAPAAPEQLSNIFVWCKELCFQVEPR